MILGIDPGIAIVGYGVISYDGYRVHLEDYGAIYTPAGMNLPERLDLLFSGMTRLMERFSPDSIAFEQIFFAKNVKTGIDVAQARGVCVAAAYRLNPSLYEYTPLQVKQAVTGYGRAEKQQVQAMVKTILGLDHVPRPDDAADAIAVAICHAQTVNYRLLNK